MNKYTSVKDINNLDQIINEAIELKKDPLKYKKLGEGKSLGLLFFNPSLRTRLSSQRAAHNLGMDVMVMNLNNEGWQLEFEDGAVMDSDKSEHVKEAAKVLSQYCEIIAIRSFPKLQDRDEDYSDPVLNAFIKHATVPVISLESATGNPLQALADLITIKEIQNSETEPARFAEQLLKEKDPAKQFRINNSKSKQLKIVLTWANHPKALPQSVPNSFVEFVKECPDLDLVITHPKGYELNAELTDGVKIEYDQNKALEGADFVYAKNWSSYNDYGKILTVDENWMLTEEKMSLGNDSKFMHCLPVRRNVIVDDQVMDGVRNLTSEQAKNRIFSAQVVLKNILEND